MNVSGFTSKLKSKADWVAFIVAAYSRMSEINPSDPLGQAMWWFTKPEGAMRGVQYSLTNLGHLKYKLWDSPHMFTGIFKLSTIARVLIELGILVPSKYKPTTEKLMKGAALAALTLPGSQGFPDHGSGSRERTLSGSDPMKGAYNK